MLPDKYKYLHDKFLDDWMHAEEVLKIVERIKNEAFIPSIKELRYASRRVVDAHMEYRRDPDNHAAIEVHLVEAIENCRKARHDALDSAINFVHDQVDKLIKVAGLDTVATGFPNYLKLKPKLNEISLLIVESRKQRQILDDKYEMIKREHLTEIVALYAEMEVAYPVIEAIGKRRSRELLKAAIIVGVIVGGLVAGAVVIADKRGLFNYFMPEGNPGTSSSATKTSP